MILLEPLSLVLFLLNGTLWRLRKLHFFVLKDVTNMYLKFQENMKLYEQYGKFNICWLLFLQKMHIVFVNTHL